MEMRTSSPITARNSRSLYCERSSAMIYSVQACPRVRSYLLIVLGLLSYCFRFTEPDPMPLLLWNPVLSRCRAGSVSLMVARVSACLGLAWTPGRVSSDQVLKSR